MSRLDDELAFITDRLLSIAAEQAGPGLADTTRALAALASAAREGDAAAVAARQALVAEHSVEQLELLAHGFSLFFQLVNLCEERERLRRLEATPSPRQSLDAILFECRAAGVTPARIQAVVDALAIEPVLTAHPTEARRRTVIDHFLRLAARFDAPDEILETLWQTTEVRTRSVTPLDEVDTAIFFLDLAMLPALPALHRQLDAALARHYPGVVRRQPVLRIASWVGGDRDGNPYVTPDVTREAADAYAALARQVYGRELAALSNELTQHVDGEPDEMTPTHPGQPGERFRHRAARLGGRVHAGRVDASTISNELADIQSGLRAQAARRAADGRIADLALLVATGGNSSVHLDVRDHTAVLHDDPAQVRAELAAMRDIRARYGRDVCHRLILSMTMQADDVLDALQLATDEGLSDLDIVPLFETIDALDRAPSIMAELWDNSGYRAHLERRGHYQEVMLGYSDSNRDGGYLAANWYLERSQGALARLAVESGVRLCFFHGKGGTVDRGGGAGHRLLRAQPDAAPGGRIRLTEQGEVIANKYANPPIALRTLEQLVSGVIAGQAMPAAPDPRLATWQAAMQRLADRSFHAYRSLIFDDASLEAYFWGATPIDFIDKHRLGSRPARRSAARDVQQLRAIPWVFSWSQSRHLVSAWYGIGTAFGEILAEPGGTETLQTMYRNWPFFGILVDNAAASLAKSEMAIARQYADLVDDAAVRDHIFGAINQEHDASLAALRSIIGNDDILASQPVLRASITRRNPWVDPLHDLQLRALAGWRDGGRADDDPRRAVLALTVNGIAAGLKSTG